MNILHVIPSFAPAWRYGGPVVAAVGLTKELARQGHNVAVMTTNIDGTRDLDVPLGRPVDMDGVEVWYYAVQRPRWYCFSRPLALALKKRVGSYDIVHVHSIFLWPTTVAAFWSRRRGVPYMIHAIGSLDETTIRKSYAPWTTSVSSRFKKWAYMRTIGRFDIDRASAIHFTSKADMEAGRALNVRPPGYVLPLGVDPDLGRSTPPGASIRERHPELRDKRIVLFLGRLDPIKGLGILLEAVFDLASRRGDFALVVAGSGLPKYDRQVRSSVRERRLEGRVVFVGHIEGADKWSLLRESDLFVLPSYHENFPIAVLEAMATGLPVVVSDKVKIHEEISEAGAGLVTGLDPTDVASAIDGLLSDEARGTRMGEAGAEYVRERWSWERAATDIASAYENIVRDGRPSAVDPVRA